MSKQIVLAPESEDVIEQTPPKAPESETALRLLSDRSGAQNVPAVRSFGILWGCAAPIVRRPRRSLSLHALDGQRGNGLQRLSKNSSATLSPNSAFPLEAHGRTIVAHEDKPKGLK
jgi:hypothetical protein